MVRSSEQMLDLMSLMGAAPPTELGQVGDDSSEQSEMPFDELVSSFLGLSAAEIAGPGEEVALQRLQSPAVLPFAVDPEGVVLPQQKLSSDIVVPENVAAFNKKLASLATIQAGKMGTDGLAIDLPPGRYDVVSANQSDGKLNLVLSSPDKQGAEIRLSIATSLLADRGDLTGQILSPTERIDINGVPKAGTLFDKLLERLNVTEIAIKEAPQPADIKATATPVQVELIANESGNSVIIKAQLNRRELQARTGPRDSNGVDKSAGSIGARPDVSSELYKQPEPKPLTAVQRHMMSQSNAMNERQGNGLLESRQGESEFVRLLAQPVNPDSFTDLSTADANKPIYRDNTLQSARLSLPYDARFQLRPNGQSIRLTIEPEHLGPAKLSLVMHGGHLSARVVVDSVAAQQAVEGSMHQLLDQLSQANIKVEKIDVAVSGGATGERQNARQPFRPGRKPNLSHKLIGDTFDASPPALARMLSAGIVASDGVNILA